MKNLIATRQTLAWLLAGILVVSVFGISSWAQPPTQNFTQIPTGTRGQQRQSGFTPNYPSPPAFNAANGRRRYEHGPDIQRLLGEIAEAPEEAQAKLSENLKTMLAEEFDEMHEAQAKEIESLEVRLEKLHSKHQQRTENKDKIIERRMSELVGSNDPYAWRPESNSGYYSRQSTMSRVFVAPQALNTNPVPNNRYGDQSENFQQWTRPGTAYPQQPSQPATPAPPTTFDRPQLSVPRNELGDPALQQGAMPQQESSLQQDPRDRASHAARE